MARIAIGFEGFVKSYAQDIEHPLEDPVTVRAQARAHKISATKHWVPATRVRDGKTVMRIKPESRLAAVLSK